MCELRSSEDIRFARSSLAPCMVNEHSPHHPGSHRQKMDSIVEGYIPLQQHAHVSFVYESRRLQGMTLAFPSQIGSGETTQFTIYQI
jgi:hypothetical protein